MTWPKGEDTLTKNLGTFDSRMQHVVTGVLEYAKPEATTYAKENAPWTDRTGNARKGLHSGTDYGPGWAELYIAHSMYYGIFLEVCNSGKYRIIEPTVRYIGDLILRRMETAFAKMQEEST
jgi:hypothetical protein